MRTTVCINKRAIMQYALLYLSYLNTSAKARSMYGDGLLIFTAAVVGMLFVLRYIKIIKRYFFSVGAFAGMILIQHVIIQYDVSLMSLMNTLTMFLVSYCAVSVNPQHFVKRFIKLTVFLASISLVCFALSFTPLESLLSSLLITNHAPCWTGDISYGRFLYHYIPNYGRNVGIFQEPGVYQLYLNLALYICLFWRDRIDLADGRRYGMTVVIIVVTIVTTRSTAAYLTTLLVVVGYLLDIKKRISTGKFLLTIGAVVGLLYFTQTQVFYDVFLRKMQFSGGTFVTGTGNARLGSIITDIDLIIRNPLGVGNQVKWKSILAVAQNEASSSVGLTSILAAYGLPIGLLMYGLFFYAFKKTTEKILHLLVLLAVFVSSFLTQPWVLSPVYLLIVAYAYWIQTDTGKSIGNL